MNSDTHIQAEDLIDFWFSERVEKFWFNSTQEFDDELRQAYESVYLNAIHDQYNNWLDSVGEFNI